MLRNLTKTLLLNKNHKYYLKTTIKLYTTEHRLQTSELEAVDKKHVDSINEILNKYSPQEEKKILGIVNNYKLNELLGYDITKGRANKLLAWRMRNGLLNNLSDILSIEGFGLKVADKFYQSLLQEPKSNDLELSKAGKSRTAPFATPSLDAEQRDRIKSCVAVKIGVNSITWARLEVPSHTINAPCEVTHWEHHEISEKKLHLNDLIQRCLYVNRLIPIADCYIFENPQMAQASNNPGSVEQQNINIQKAQVIAIMGCALSSRNSQIRGLPELKTDKEMKYSPNVFYLRRFLTARLFNHLVGTERVSSEETVLNLMRTYYNTNGMDSFLTSEEDTLTTTADDQNIQTQELNLSGRIQFPIQLREIFAKSPRYYREFLGQALLMNLTFVRLVLLQDADSIALVTRGNKPKTS